MAERKWTKPQLDAINAESGTILVSAAAGSGKTSVLVERIVRKLTRSDNPVLPEQLLVVTFTNAAAAEMRSRVFERISQKRLEEPAKRQEYIKLLSRLDEMKICTMDSFCISLVREHFSHCGISPDFTILENGQAALMKKKVVEDVIEYLYKNDSENFVPLTRLFEKGLNDANLSASILSLSASSMAQPSDEKWLDGVGDNFLPVSADEGVWGEILISNAADKLSYAKLLAEEALSVLSFEEELYGKIGHFFEEELRRIDELILAFPNFSWNDRCAAVLRLINYIKDVKFRAPNGYSENPFKNRAYAKRGEYKSLLEKIYNTLNISEEENAEDIGILKPMADELIKAAKLFNRKLLEEKKEQSAFEFSDITRFALSLLYDPTKADPKTALAYSLSENFNEILIDEYQDTSRVQDTLFNCLSKNGENMFMVGDVKQSIYRFRLASPEIFIEKSESFPYYDGKEKKSKIILSQNFRSRKGVVDTVNFFFDALLSKKCGEIDYTDDEKLNFSASYFPESNEADTNLHIVENSEMKSHEAEAVYTAKLIKKELEAGTPVFSKGENRRCKPSDFCILLRSTKGLASVFANALKNEGISVSVNAGEDFFDTAQIKMIMSFLYVLDNPSRDVSLLALMLSPLFGFTPDELAQIKINARKNRLPKGSSLFAAVSLLCNKGDKKCRDLCDKISFYRRLSVTCSAGELLEKLYDDFSCTGVVLSMDDGEKRKNDLLQLLELAYSYSGETKKGLGGFIRRLDAFRENGVPIEKGTASSGENSVSIMTMHGSKGLEFPFVIISGLNKQFFTSDLNSSLLINHEYGIGLKRQEPEKIKLYDTLSSLAVKTRLKSEKLSEELRIHYVALTRAKEKLHIVIALNDIEKKISSIGEILSDTTKLPAEYVSSVSNPAVWYLSAFIHHPDAENLRVYSDFVAPTSSNINVFCTHEDFYEFEEPFEPIFESADEEIVKRISEKVNFVYPYLSAATALSKHTASALDGEEFSTQYFASTVPAFLSEAKLTPADIGTATHRFLQFCDFSKCKESPEAELDRLVARNRLSELMGQSVDMKSIEMFFNSPTMKRIENAESVFREKQFTLSKSICDMDSSIDEKFRNEKTVIVGKIDLIFIENGEAVILDYKTDNVKNVNELAKRYARQLDLYSEAVEKAMGIRVKERILYSLKLREYINV